MKYNQKVFLTNNIYSYSSLQEVKLTHTLQCRLYLVSDFQIREYAKRRKRSLTVEKPSKHYINQVVKVNITSDKPMFPDMVWWKMYLTFVVLLAKPITLA